MSNLFNCLLPEREKVKTRKLKNGYCYVDITSEEACAIFRAYADGELVTKNEVIGLSSDVAMENECFCSMGERE